MDNLDRFATFYTLPRNCVYINNAFNLALNVLLHCHVKFENEKYYQYQQHPLQTVTLFQCTEFYRYKCSTKFAKRTLK